jgi:hypothetical protein
VGASGASLEGFHFFYRFEQAEMQGGERAKWLP